MFFKTSVAISALLVALVDCSNVPGGKVVLGGDMKEAKRGELPAFATVVSRASGQMITGGVLLQSQVVLTLGSSYIGVSPEDVYVVLGVQERSLGVVEGQIVNVTEIIVHPDVTNSSTDPIEGDVALMKLEQPAELGRYVMPLGVENVQGRKNHVSARAARKSCVYGFLRNAGSAPIGAEKLQRFEPEVMSSKDCKASATQYGMSWNGQAWICSTEDAFANTCSGSGGEPLLFGSRSRGFELRGLVPRRTPDYCYRGYTVYTRLTQYHSWITETANAMETS